MVHVLRGPAGGDWEEFSHQLFCGPYSTKDLPVDYQNGSSAQGVLCPRGVPFDGDEAAAPPTRFCLKNWDRPTSGPVGCSLYLAQDGKVRPDLRL